MLVLSRKLDESLVINGNIEIVITGISGNKVSLGIVAPSDVAVFRKELCSATEEKQIPKQSTPSQSCKKKTGWNVVSGIQSLR